LLDLKQTSLKVVVAVLGILAAGVPMLLFSAWLKKQGDDEASITAARVLGSAETRLGQAVATLYDLSARGVDSCQPSHVAAMRQAVLLTAPVKEVMLIAPGGQIMCTDTGGTIGPYDVLDTSATANADIVLDAVQRPDRGERFLRIRKTGGHDKPTLAASVPVSLLLPQASAAGVRPLSHVRMTMADGTPLGDSGAAPNFAGSQDAQALNQAQSKQYRIAVTVSMARRDIVARYDDLRRISMVVSGVIATIILFFALIYLRRDAGNSAGEIAKAILGDQFVPYYQPIVDIQTGRLLGAEVLVRWRRADGSLMEPLAFVSTIEASGLVLELTRSLMRRVRDDLDQAIGSRPEMRISFNVAPQHFDDVLILHDIGTIFDNSPIKLTQIVLELTERYQVKNFTSTRRTIAALQGLGCKVAIDDVGTGHSGLSYILKLGVDIIKIDRMFVDAIGAEGHSKAIIETLIDLAKNMRMEIIAEGVETFDQVSYLRERGISAAQGYIFAPPLPADSFRHLLDAMDPLADADGAAKTGDANAAKSAAKPIAARGR
jgi:sensor c-di-GMP phosphodiesterase-like protein